MCKLDLNMRKNMNSGNWHPGVQNRELQDRVGFMADVASLDAHQGLVGGAVRIPECGIVGSVTEHACCRRYGAFVGDADFLFIFETTRPPFSQVTLRWRP